PSLRTLCCSRPTCVISVKSLGCAWKTGWSDYRSRPFLQQLPKFLQLIRRGARPAEARIRLDRQRAGHRRAVGVERHAVGAGLERLAWEGEPALASLALTLLRLVAGALALLWLVAGDGVPADAVEARLLFLGQVEVAHDVVVQVDHLQRQFLGLLGDEVI